MQETTNLKLKKPDLTDYVNVGDLNENADKIDAAIQENKEGFTTHLADYTTFKDSKGQPNGLAALDGGRQIPAVNLGNVPTPAVFGTYTGNNNVSQTITLGFKPSAVFVMPKDSDTKIGSTFTSGLALDGFPANEMVIITPNGFLVGRTDIANTNSSSALRNPYRYIAFK